jgi:hypothetical protein
MASEFEHVSPDEKALVIHLNNPYSTLITKVSEGMLGIANDLNAIVAVDKDGNSFKTFQDSTGASSIPEDSIVVADANGQATYNAEFKIDFTNALIQFPLPFTLAFGNQSTNGSMRIKVASTGISFGKRVAGIWEEVSLTA